MASSPIQMTRSSACDLQDLRSKVAQSVSAVHYSADETPRGHVVDLVDVDLCSRAGTGERDHDTAAESLSRRFAQL